MQAKLQRFDFGALQDFAGPLKPRTPKAAAKAEEAPPPAPVYSQAQLEAASQEARQAGYQEGVAAGVAEEKKRQDTQTALSEQALMSLTSQLVQLAAAYQETLAQQSLKISQLALLIAKKVAGAALDTQAETAIEGLIRETAPLLFSKPKAVIELHPDILSKLQARVEQYFAQQRYTGELSFHANDALPSHDARIHWDSGVLSRDTGTLWQQIEALIGSAKLTPPSTSSS